jgi:glycerol-3-phosphate acyltransferase PlsY
METLLSSSVALMGTGYLGAIVLGIVAAYFLAGFPSAIVIGKGLCGIDVRKHGSGNVGTTNTIRVLGWGPGLFVCAIDILKGSVSVLIMEAFLSWLTPTLTMGIAYDIALLLGGVAAVCGHMFTPYLHFRGGKGVATGYGAALVFLPWACLTILIVFVVLVSSTRIVSLGSVVGVIALPVSIAFLYPKHPVFLVFGIIVAMLVVWAHRGNIRRLLTHTEPKFSAGHRPVSDDSGKGKGARR